MQVSFPLRAFASLLVVMVISHLRHSKVRLKRFFSHGQATSEAKLPTVIESKGGQASGPALPRLQGVCRILTITNRILATINTISSTPTGSPRQPRSSTGPPDHLLDHQQKSWSSTRSSTGSTTAITIIKGKMKFWQRCTPNVDRLDAFIVEFTLAIDVGCGFDGSSIAELLSRSPASETYRLESTPAIGYQCVWMVTLDARLPLQITVCNRFVQHMEIKDEHMPIGMRMDSWICNEGEILDCVIDRALPTGLTSIEIRLPFSENPNVGKHSRRLLDLLHMFASDDILFEHPISKQWTSISAKLHGSLAVVDLETREMVVAMWCNLQTRRVCGSYGVLTLNQIEHIDRVRSHVVGSFAFRKNIPMHFATVGRKGAEGNSRYLSISAYYRTDETGKTKVLGTRIKDAFTHSAISRWVKDRGTTSLAARGIVNTEECAFIVPETRQIFKIKSDSGHQRLPFVYPDLSALGSLAQSMDLSAEESANLPSQHLDDRVATFEIGRRYFDFFQRHSGRQSSRVSSVVDGCILKVLAFSVTDTTPDGESFCELLTEGHAFYQSTLEISRYIENIKEKVKCHRGIYHWGPEDCYIFSFTKGSRCKAQTDQPPAHAPKVGFGSWSKAEAARRSKIAIEIVDLKLHPCLKVESNGKMTYSQDRMGHLGPNAVAGSASVYNLYSRVHSVVEHPAECRRHATWSVHGIRHPSSSFPKQTTKSTSNTTRGDGSSRNAKVDGMETIVVNIDAAVLKRKRGSALYLDVQQNHELEWDPCRVDWGLLILFAYCPASMAREIVRRQMELSPRERARMQHKITYLRTKGRWPSGTLYLEAEAVLCQGTDTEECKEATKAYDRILNKASMVVRQSPLHVEDERWVASTSIFRDTPENWGIACGRTKELKRKDEWPYSKMFIEFSQQACSSIIGCEHHRHGWSANIAALTAYGRPQSIGRHGHRLSCTHPKVGREDIEDRSASKNTRDAGPQLGEKNPLDMVAVKGWQLDHVAGKVPKRSTLQRMAEVKRAERRDGREERAGRQLAHRRGSRRGSAMDSMENRRVKVQFYVTALKKGEDAHPETVLAIRHSHGHRGGSWTLPGIFGILLVRSHFHEGTFSIGDRIIFRVFCSDRYQAISVSIRCRTFWVVHASVIGPQVLSRLGTSAQPVLLFRERYEPYRLQSVVFGSKLHGSESLKNLEAATNEFRMDGVPVWAYRRKQWQSAIPFCKCTFYRVNRMLMFDEIVMEFVEDVFSSGCNNVVWPHRQTPPKIPDSLFDVMRTLRSESVEEEKVKNIITMVDCDTSAYTHAYTPDAVDGGSCSQCVSSEGPGYLTVDNQVVCDIGCNPFDIYYIGSKKSPYLYAPDQVYHHASGRMCMQFLERGIFSEKERESKMSATFASVAQNLHPPLSANTGAAPDVAVDPASSLWSLAIDAQPIFFLGPRSKRAMEVQRSDRDFEVREGGNDSKRSDTCNLDLSIVCVCESVTSNMQFNSIRARSPQDLSQVGAWVRTAIFASGSCDIESGSMIPTLLWLRQSQDIEPLENLPGEVSNLMLTAVMLRYGYKFPPLRTTMHRSIKLHPVDRNRACWEELELRKDEIVDG
ncbi:hypothetical protein BDK51DRAFT_28539 [Blyttiomyces helicus]|uniref:Uncharacterized protein n=1 Tax=Blyttiomyces helicus TaxID=388810 RepID=A0A4P9WSW4_9FUNG|nr:hypothetical protein BDK51DRAFT_28539 [Blyttiomyces helicus]|eukprot:RKO94410.1 hypothetical protein BDK51DRAFT_28539 [Blyttiomyces helicus]